MPRRDPEQRYPGPGRRVSLRRGLAGGGQGDLVGFVVAADATGITVRDRWGRDHAVAWTDVRALRQVGVARGRDPLRTPLADLDRLAADAGLTGRVFVVRLSDLLDARIPPPLGAWTDPPPAPAALDGEWLATGDAADLPALGWWAAHHDARSLQVRTASEVVAARLRALGFAERTQ